MPQGTYASLMAEGTPFIELRIELSDPPELLTLVSAMAAIGHQFEGFIARHHPNLAGEARLFVKEIRKGSTIFELIPHIPALIATMDAVLIVDDFVTRYRGLLSGVIAGNVPPAISKSDVKDYLNTVRLMAKDTKGSATLTSSVYREKGTEKRIEFEFSTRDAQKAVDLLERKTIELDTPIQETKENVLLVLWQSSREETDPGKRTAQRGIIEAMWPKPLAIRFVTEMANDKFAYWITQGDKNVYKLGFYVDCYVERLRGRPVAYNVYSIRDVIDLPDDEE